MRMIKVSIPAVVVAVTALLWGSLSASTRLEFGAAAWLAGAIIGLTVAFVVPDRRRAARASVVSAIVCTALAKCFFVYGPWGAARPTLAASLRAIDLLWLAMACSAAHWLSSASRARRSSGSVAQASPPSVVPPAVSRPPRPQRPIEPRPARGVRWNLADRDAAHTDRNRTP